MLPGQTDELFPGDELPDYCLLPSGLGSSGGENFCIILDLCVTYMHREASSYEKEIGWEFLSHRYLSESCFPAKVFEGTQHK